MKTQLAIAFFTLAALAPVTTAQTCTPGQADPATYNVIDLTGVGDHYYYLEERDTGLPPVPGSGFVLANGTWLYYEENGLGGLQRGGIGLTGDCFPGHGTIPPDPNGDLIPCLIIDEDPITDENCGTSPDHIVF